VVLFLRDSLLTVNLFWTLVIKWAIECQRAERAVILWVERDVACSATPSGVLCFLIITEVWARLNYVLGYVNFFNVFCCWVLCSIGPRLICSGPESGGTVAVFLLTIFSLLFFL
jgi:hypothetical protein